MKYAKISLANCKYKLDTQVKLHISQFSFAAHIYNKEQKSSIQNPQTRRLFTLTFLHSFQISPNRHQPHFAPTALKVDTVIIEAKTVKSKFFKSSVSQKVVYYTILA